MSSNAWEDAWFPSGPLILFMSYRFIHSVGYTTNTTVKELLDNLDGVWPNEWIQRFPQLANVLIPGMSDTNDRIKWLAPNNSLVDFTVQVAWRSLEDPGNVISWYKVVWNKAYIPKHALCMWMACHKRLPTQDRLIQWNLDQPDVKCLFCKGTVESHNHLFFECAFSLKVWSQIKNEVLIDSSPDKWDDILSHWAQGNRRWSTAQKLAISASVYHLWIERNNRFFENRSQTEDQLISLIKREVLMRIARKEKKRRLVIP